MSSLFLEESSRSLPILDQAYIDRTAAILKVYKLPFFGNKTLLENFDFALKPLDDWCDEPPIPRIPASQRVPTSVYYPRPHNRYRLENYTYDQLTAPYFVTKDWKNFYRPHYEEDKDHYVQGSCMWKAGYARRKVERILEERLDYYSKPEAEVLEPVQDLDRDLDSLPGCGFRFTKPRFNSEFIKPKLKKKKEIQKNKPGVVPEVEKPDKNQLYYPESTYFQTVSQILKKMLKVGEFDEDIQSERETDASSLPEEPELNWNCYYVYNLPVGVSKDGEPFDFLKPSVGPPQPEYWTNRFFQCFFVSRVIGPGHFYVQNNETQQDLYALNAFMTEWYDEYWPKSPTFRKQDLLLNGFYAVYLEEYEEWYRCTLDDIVSSVDIEIEVVVQLIDYGTIAIVKIDCLLPLRKVYCELPIQAAVAMLHDTRDRIWTPKETNLFIKEIGGSRLDGLILEQNLHPGQIFQSLSLVLINIVNNEECFYDLGGTLIYGYVVVGPKAVPPKAISDSKDAGGGGDSISVVNVDQKLA